MSNCTWFPAAAFAALLASGDFDVRWPVTFAAWYWSASGATVDEACADFLSAADLWDQAREVLPEYDAPILYGCWRGRGGLGSVAEPGTGPDRSHRTDFVRVEFVAG